MYICMYVCITHVCMYIHVSPIGAEFGLRDTSVSTSTDTNG